MSTDKLITVPLAKCELHPGNRKHLGDMKELTADIVDNGVEVPLIGRYLNTDQTHQFYPERKGEQVFQVLAGARRLTAVRSIAAKAAEGSTWRDVPMIQVIERDLDDLEAFRFLMRENLHREDVHPLDEADYFLQLIEEGASVEMIAAELGKSESFVHKRLQLNELTPAGRKLYEAQKFGAAVAMELARLPKMAQDDMLKRIRQIIDYDGEIGPKQVRTWALKFHTLKLAHAAFPTTDPTLWKAAGACNECPKRSGNTPSLFGDLTKEDVCTDRTCYEQKGLHWLDSQLAKLKAEGIDWRPVSKDWRSQATSFDGKPIVGSQNWQECRQKEDHAFRALIVASEVVGDVGRTLWAKGRERFKSAPPSPQQKAARAREARLIKVKGLHRRLMFQAVSDTKVTQTQLDTKVIALAFFKRLWSDSQKEVCKIMGWDPIKQQSYNGWDYETTAKKRLEVMTKLQVLQFLNTLTVAHDVTRTQWDNSNKTSDDLTRRAKELGVDVAKLKRQAEAKFPAAKKTTKKKGAKRAKSNATKHGA